MLLLGNGTSTSNERIAMRIAEVITDYRTLQESIADSWVDPPNPQAAHEAGFTVLRDSYNKAQTLLGVSFPPEPPAGLSPNSERAQLQQ
jgi:hypothetical protein